MTHKLISPEGFMSALTSGAQINCPTCGRYAQIYRRNVTSTMAKLLIEAHSKFANNPFHVNHLVHEGSPASGFTGLKYWNLIEAHISTITHEPIAGEWFLTDKGSNWVEKRTRIPKYKFLFDDEVLKTEEPYVSILDALKTKFSYEELMKPVFI